MLTSFDPSHLAKRPSDLKNGTQEKTQFCDTVFHTLSHGVPRFVANGSFTNHGMEAFDWLSKNFNQSEGGLLSYHLQQNRADHAKRY